MQITNSEFTGLRHLRPLPKIPSRISWWYIGSSICMLGMMIVCNVANLRVESFIFSFLFGLSVYATVSYYFKVKSLEAECSLLAIIKTVIETPVYEKIDDNVAVFTWLVAEIPDECFGKEQK